MRAGLLGALLGGVAVFLLLHSTGREQREASRPRAAADTPQVPVDEAVANSDIKTPTAPNAADLRELMILRDEVGRLRHETREGNDQDHIPLVALGPNIQESTPAAEEGFTRPEFYQRVIRFNGLSDVQNIATNFQASYLSKDDQGNPVIELPGTERVIFQPKDHAVVLRSSTEQGVQSLAQAFEKFVTPQMVQDQ